MKWKFTQLNVSTYDDIGSPDQNHIICLVILNAMRSEVLRTFVSLANWHLFIYINYTTAVIANAH